MNIREVSMDNVYDFIQYVQQYGKEHDDSFLPNCQYIPNEEQPSYIRCSESGVIGAVSLLKSKQYTVHHKARFAVFHAIEQSYEAYSQLLNAILKHVSGLNYIYAFIPEDKTETRRIWGGLGFYIERFAYVLKHHGGVEKSEIPEGYTIEAIDIVDEDKIIQFCDVWNHNYSGSIGFMGINPHELKLLIIELPGSAMLLRKGNQAIGTVHINREEDSAFIEMLSINEEYRGLGLGRLLLNKVIEVAHNFQLNSVYLSVNSQNESAVKLYLSNGFEKDMVMVCYRLDI